MKKIAFLILTCSFVALCGAQSARPMVSNLTSSLLANNSQVQLSWTIPHDASAQIAELHVYRNIGSIIKTSTLSLLSPTTILPSDTIYYVDEIRTSEPHYYAVVAKTNGGILYDVIIPTVNATDKPIEKKQNQITVTPEAPRVDLYANATTTIESSVAVPMREKPLPYIDILSTKEKQDAPAVSKEALSVTAKATIQKTTMFLEPIILEEDRNAENATGDDYTLSLIVDTSIIQEDWIKAEEDLLKFLEINRSSLATARANFYLAQSYYFKQDYRNALTHFQKAERLYPMYSKRWIEEVLNKFTIG